eukprot:scaffold31419_cov69-Phaeocystis_antarctica.AAC.2
MWPRSCERVTREVEGHALVVQPEVDRIENLDAAARPPAGRHQLLEHHQHRVLVRRSDIAADISVGRGCAGRQCHDLEGLDFGAEGCLAVGRGRGDTSAAHSQRARQLFIALDDLDEAFFLRGFFDVVRCLQTDDRDTFVGGIAQHLVGPRIGSMERPFKNDVGPAIYIEKGVIKVCAISVGRRAFGGEVEHLGQHDLLLRRWVR